MIYITKGATNSIVLTLTESSKLTEPYYIFEFQNEYVLGSEPIIFSTPDLSNYTDRYNLFRIEESSTGATASAYDEPISLITGQYKYKVYETDTIEGWPILNLTVNNLVEEGRMVVSGNSDNIETLIDNIYI